MVVYIFNPKSIDTKTYLSIIMASIKYNKQKTDSLVQENQTLRKDLDDLKLLVEEIINGNNFFS